METFDKVIKESSYVQKVLNFWAKKIITDEEYNGIDENELSKYYEIKDATNVVLGLHELNYPDFEIKSYPYYRRKISKHLAHLILNEYIPTIIEINKELNS